MNLFEYFNESFQVIQVSSRIGKNFNSLQPRVWNLQLLKVASEFELKISFPGGVLLRRENPTYLRIFRKLFAKSSEVSIVWSCQRICEKFIFATLALRRWNVQRFLGFNYFFRVSFIKCLLEMVKPSTFSCRAFRSYGFLKIETHLKKRSIRWLILHFNCWIVKTLCEVGDFWRWMLVRRIINLNPKLELSIFFRGPIEVLLSSLFC